MLNKYPRIIKIMEVNKGTEILTATQKGDIVEMKATYRKADGWVFVSTKCRTLGVFNLTTSTEHFYADDTLKLL